MDADAGSIFNADLHDIKICLSCIESQGKSSGYFGQYPEWQSGKKRGLLQFYYSRSIRVKVEWRKLLIFMVELNGIEPSTS